MSRTQLILRSYLYNPRGYFSVRWIFHWIDQNLFFGHCKRFFSDLISFADFPFPSRKCLIIFNIFTVFSFSIPAILKFPSCKVYGKLKRNVINHWHCIDSLAIKNPGSFVFKWNLTKTNSGSKENRTNKRTNEQTNKRTNKQKEHGNLHAHGKLIRLD